MLPRTGVSGIWTQGWRKPPPTFIVPDAKEARLHVREPGGNIVETHKGKAPDMIRRKLHCSPSFLAGCDHMAAPRPHHMEGAAAFVLAAGSSSDRAALSALWLAAGGLDWNRDDNWATSAPLGDWYGVTADSLDRVTRLSLSRNNLTGPIPLELGNLERLRYLNLCFAWATAEAVPRNWRWRS